MKTKLLLSFLCLWAVACGDETSRPEVVTKLRAIGVNADQPVSSPSTDPAAPKTITLTLFYLLGVNETAAVSYFQDQTTNSALLVQEQQVSIADPTTYKETAFDNFKVVEAKATITVPVLTLTVATQMKYGFKIQSGSEEEAVIGYLPLYPEGSPELAFTTPTVQIASPADGATISNDLDITATYTNPNNEDLKFGWFASTGEIKNRRAKNTHWSALAGGKQTLLMTVRGKKSRAFSYHAVHVTVQ